MALSKPKPRQRLLKRLLIFLGIVALLVIALHLWFVHNARTVLKDYISEQSGGKIKLELSRLHLNLWTRQLQIHEADLVSTDSVNEAITYHVTFNELSLRVGSLWSLLIDKELLLDSIKLYDPVIQVMQWRKDSAQVHGKEELSIPQEMGKIYKSMLSALDEFGIRRIVIENARISLINKMKPASEPVTVSNLFFDLARTPTRQGKKNVYLHKDQTVEVRTSYQNIALPGGRHRLSFKSFKLQLFGERIDLDSCTIAAVPKDSLRSNYKIFFKKLSLTGVDLSAMSLFNLIKADSVYCEEPLFDFNLYRSDAVKKKTEKPDPDEIVRELTGNLNLGFVGVKNAGIHFDIYGRTHRSFFNSNKDNFEMYGLRINPDSSKPVTINQFNMTLRDYRLYNEDSSSIISFDSLNFLNDKIALNNFAVLSRPGRKKILNDIDIKVPYFELSQLDWYQLIFDQNIVANAAVLNNPVINYTRRKALRTTRRKTNLFAAIQNLDSLVAINNVRVINGQVNMKLGPETSFNVEDLNFNVHSDELLQSTTREGLRSAVENLSFSKGLLKLKDITARLTNTKFTGNNLIYAEKVFITGRGNTIEGTINNVNINNMLLDDNAETIEVDGIKWASAALKLHSVKSKGAGKTGNNTVHLRNVMGNNTLISFSNGRTSVSTFVEAVKAASIIKHGKQIQLEGFNINGSDLLLKSKTASVNAASYFISGNEASSIYGLKLQQVKGRDSLNAQSSHVTFTTNLNNIFSNKYHFENVEANGLIVKMDKWDTAQRVESGIQKPPITIQKLIAHEPQFHLSAHRNDSVSVVNIPKSGGSKLQASGIVLDAGNIQVQSLLLNTSAATFTKPTGEVMGVEKGKIEMDLSNLSFGKTNGKINWGGSVKTLSLEGAKGLNMGKAKNLRFQDVYLGNINLSSEYLPDIGQVIKRNLSAWLRIPQGEFIDSSTTLKWYNANYSNNNRTLSLDSFVYFPTNPLDSVLAHAPYQLDYITMKTGKVNIAGLDVAKYEMDSSFSASSINISDALLTVYRDKKPPLSPFRKEKPLPVNLIRRISLPLSVDQLELNNGIIIYSEKNAKSREEGNLLLTNVSATLSNIKNRNLLNDDSLQLTFNARLMDTVDIAIKLKESYLDTLSGFLMTGKMQTTGLWILNPVLIPLSNVKITSGILDSVSFSVVGRKDIALGEMNMHYHDLKIKLIKAGDADKSTFVQNVVSFIANTFVIKNSNTRRKGVIFYNRTVNQSFVNYIVKMTLSGMATSVGAKKNKKYLKQYKKELKESGRPAI